jgi:hypothetical protein
VLELKEPARLVVDLRPAGAGPKEPPPARGGETVLVEPRPGARVSDPLTVSGYSRNFEASNTIVLKNGKGETLVRETVIANDWSSTWGYFEATLDLPPLQEKGTLSVGTGAPATALSRASRSRSAAVRLTAGYFREPTKWRGSSGSPVARRTVSRQFSRAPGPKKDSSR